MDRKKVPLILMLTAGALSIIITWRFDAVAKLTVLLVTLIVFYIFGCALRWSLDYFDRQNEEKKAQEQEGEAQEGEVIEKEADDDKGPGEA